MTLASIPWTKIGCLIDGAYAIATPPNPEGVIDLELHIRHLQGGLFTDRLFAGDLRERSFVRFEGPLGTFIPREESDKPIVLLASGTGFAPMKSMLRYAFSRAIPARRRMVLYWGGRHPPRSVSVFCSPGFTTTRPPS